MDIDLPAAMRDKIERFARFYSVPFDSLVEIWQDGARTKLGSTGVFPHGAPLGRGDKGELRAALSCDHIRRIVRIDFGTPVDWLAMSAAHTREFAQALLVEVDKLERGDRP